ncbi:NYN domainlimkain-b1-type [Penicillium lividum]|nr:NYN domainlimkain-b1-type [Penicillium lividum]
MVGDTVPKLAVLIDADNAQFSSIHLLLSEIAKYGTAHAKRAYGDWSSPYLKGWKDQLLEQSIQPIQQFAYTYGKNATDSAMIIDAMDLLYSSRYDGFCLVSSDSDFTRLAARIRESGLIVYGLGTQITPKPFVAACDKFIYTENLVDLDKLVPHAKDPPLVKQAKKDRKLEDKLRTTVEAASKDDGWVKLIEVSHLLTKNQPDFDARTYGYHKLSDLVADISFFETSQRRPGEGKQTITYIRDKRRKPISSDK